jgi:hypothetical protein
MAINVRDSRSLRNLARPGGHVDALVEFADWAPTIDQQTTGFGEDCHFAASEHRASPEVGQWRPQLACPGGAAIVSLHRPQWLL